MTPRDTPVVNNLTVVHNLHNSSNFDEELLLLTRQSGGHAHCGPDWCVGCGFGVEVLGRHQTQVRHHYTQLSTVLQKYLRMVIELWVIHALWRSIENFKNISRDKIY